MKNAHRTELAAIKRFDQLVRYLRDNMGWPIESDNFEEVTFEYTAEELGIDPKNAAKIQEIKRLRPLSASQPWGIFFVKFEPKRLPVLALRRILSQVALKKRATANKSERQAWAADDLLFVSNYGEGDERQISFAHFSAPEDKDDLPTLKVLGWDNLDTALHLDAVEHELREHLSWPSDAQDVEQWRNQWRSAFTLRHREVITTSKELSIRLAELARNIRDRIKRALDIETDRGPLKKLMKAFQESLVHDLTPDGFADMYAQTIAYGLLSARITNPKQRTTEDFAAHLRTNPFLRELMETFIKAGGRHGKSRGQGIDFDELGVSDVVELLDDANMEQVILDFGDKNPQEDPVIHFYESFLKEYDAKERKQRGVFYTPRPVVSYIVRSVDELLRTEFGLAEGLADTTTWGEMAKRHKDIKIPQGVSPDQDFVQILDPATGTGTFLVEIIDLIHKSLEAKWKAHGHNESKIIELWNEYVPQHLLTRLHGYELLMAPYAIAHLKIGLKLFETGYLFGHDGRVRVYLTNALEAALESSGRFSFAVPALAHEVEAVNKIKLAKLFTVVTGNPPYSSESHNPSVDTEGNLTHIGQLMRKYFEVDGQPLNERNPRWLQDDYVKFMRLAEMELSQTGVGVLGLITNHGYLANPTFRGMRYSLLDTLSTIHITDLHGNSKRGETCPDGSLDENVFDIQQGVAITVATKSPSGQQVCDVTTANVFGLRAMKYSALHKNDIIAQRVSPAAPFYLFVPENESIREEFRQAISLPDVFSSASVGIVTGRDALTLHFTPDEAAQMAKTFISMSPSKAREHFTLGPDSRDWQVSLAQADLKSQSTNANDCVEIMYRPFDVRFTFYSGKSRGFHCMPRGDNMGHMIRVRNLGLITARSNKSQHPDHFFCTRLISEAKSGESTTQSCLFPLYLVDEPGRLALDDGVRHGFRREFLSRMSQSLALQNSPQTGLPKGITPEDIFYYSYGVFHSPGYRSRYAEFLKIDFPRLPLTGSVGLFRELSRLGSELVTLHLIESHKLDRFVTEYIGGRAPEVEKVSWSRNTVWLDKEQTIGFKGVREEVWNFHIGGYQVCEKWLKDRKGRKLLKADIEHYQRIVVAISETIRLMKEIDEVIEKYGGWPGAFQQKAEAKVVRFEPKVVSPKVKERYVSCVPMVPLKIAAGSFGEAQNVDESSFEWIALETRHKLRKGMFVAQVVGKSMEPTIPDGSYCLFASPVEGSRQGKTVLVQLRDAKDPETGQRYTVKRYESVKAKSGDSWKHEKITLKPVNPEFKPIVLEDAEEGEYRVIAEVVEVLGSK